MGKFVIDDISDINRLIHHTVSHHANEAVFPFLVSLVMIGDEHFVSFSRSHHPCP